MLTKIFKPSSKKLLLSSLLFVLSIIFLLPLMTTLMENIAGTAVTPDSDFFYDTSRLIEIKALYGPIGGDIYFKTRFTLDLLWPMVYLFFMINSLGVLLDKLRLDWCRRFIMSLPFIGVILDLMENIFCSIYMCLSQNVIISYSAVISSSLKWLVILSILFIQAMLLLAQLIPLSSRGTNSIFK